MKGDDWNYERASGDHGQLEILYANNLKDETYKFYINWYSGDSAKVYYKLYLTREFCGQFLARTFIREEDRCSKFILKQY